MVREETVRRRASSSRPYNRTTSSSRTGPMMNVRHLIAATLLLSENACDAERRAAASDLPTWVVDANAEQVTTVGGSDEREGYAVFRLTAAHFLNDSTFFLADGGDTQIRIYSRAGELIHAFGQSGEGPGEFKGIWAAAATHGGSRITVFDLGLQRLTEFSTDGTQLRTTSFPPGSRGVNLSERIMDDGSILLRPMFVLTGKGRPEGIFRDSISWMRLSLDGTVDTLGPTPSWYKDFRRVSESFTTSHQVVLSPRTLVAGQRGTILFGQSDSGIIQRLDTRGTVLAEYHVELDRRHVTETDSDMLRRRTFAARKRNMAGSGFAEPTPSDLDEIAIMDSFPLFERLFVDDDGSAWLGLPTAPSDTATIFLGLSEEMKPERKWIVIGGRVLDIRGQNVLLRVKDEFDRAEVRWVRARRYGA